MARLAPAAMFFDAGGVLVLPRRDLVARALASVGVGIDSDAVPAAHYRAVRALDRGAGGLDPPGYLPALCSALGIGAPRLAEAAAALAVMADREASGEILWSEPVPGAREALCALRDAAIPAVVVTNSDGHGEQNLRDAGICQVGPGAGIAIAAVIDSTRVGHVKPDPAIFAVALARAGVAADQVAHLGDMVSTDIDGARAAGIAAIHLDPPRRCRSRGHPHITGYGGLWRHIALAP